MMDPKKHIKRHIETRAVYAEDPLHELLRYVKMLFADDYSILNIDLSIARSNQQIEYDVISFTILHVDPGATATLTIFDQANQELRIPDDIGEGATFGRLRCAKLYISNDPQPGLSIKILTLKSSMCIEENIGVRMKK